VAELWAWLDSTVVGHFVLKGVGPRGRTSGHGGVIVKAIPVEHVKHGVTTNGQEWSPHALDILGTE